MFFIVINVKNLFDRRLEVTVISLLLLSLCLDYLFVLETRVRVYVCTLKLPSEGNQEKTKKKKKKKKGEKNITEEEKKIFHTRFTSYLPI